MFFCTTRALRNRDVQITEVKGADWLGDQDAIQHMCRLAPEAPNVVGVDARMRAWPVPWQEEDCDVYACSAGLGECSAHELQDDLEEQERLMFWCSA